MAETILTFNHITKLFPGVCALDDVSMEFSKGEIHAIVGENGAGKSTLIKILAGAHAPTSGTINVFGREFSASSHYTPVESVKLGISVIYQEFNLIPYLTVAENVFFGREVTSGGLLRKAYMEQETRKLCTAMGVDLDPATQVKDLSVAYQQIVEIVKTLSWDAKIVVMDEPTAPLTNTEIGFLFSIVRKLKENGVTIIYISHRLEEVFEICDRVSIMRDGKYIATKSTADVTKAELIKLMIGRTLNETFRTGSHMQSDVILSVRNLSTGKLKDVSLDLHKGEILGLGGLVGSGRTETARAIFGADECTGGEILVNGARRNIRKPADAIGHGIGLLPEDRKRHGLVLGMQVKENITHSILRTITRFGLLQNRRERELAGSLKDSLRIKTPRISMKALNLSGGNQQKVVLAKWLATKSDVLLFDEPTRGIDVGAKQEIYHLMHELTKEGKAIIMISSEMPELIGMADRIVVMNEGRIGGILERAEFSQERILQIASEKSAKQDGGN